MDVEIWYRIVNTLTWQLWPFEAVSLADLVRATVRAWAARKIDDVAVDVEHPTALCDKVHPIPD